MMEVNINVILNLNDNLMNKCPKCQIGLEIVKSSGPFHDDYLICPECDGTYNILDVPKYRCIWCMKDTFTNPCEFCGNSDHIYIKGAKHTCHWSRKTINSMECKICERVISNEDYFSGKNL
mgnify:CR=1 FL=1